MVSVLASDAVDHGFELRSAGHTESNLSGKGQVKQAVLRRKSKNWSAGIKKIFPQVAIYIIDFEGKQKKS
jgi:hypothetical protein